MRDILDQIEVEKKKKLKCSAQHEFFSPISKFKVFKFINIIKG